MEYSFISFTPTVSLTTSSPSLQIIIIVAVNDDRDRTRPSLPERPSIAQFDPSWKVQQTPAPRRPSDRSQVVLGKYFG
jgi:hypothetical protein